MNMPDSVGQRRLRQVSPTFEANCVMQAHSLFQKGRLRSQETKAEIRAKETGTSI